MIAKKRTGWFTFIRILANDTKLKFKIGSPATDGKTIWLPALPAELVEEDLVLFKGDSFHEVGHIMYSDIPYFMEFAKQGGAHRFLLNALDDVFMEAKCSSWKKMAEDFIRQSTQILIKRKQFIDGSKSLVEALGAFILVYLTAKRWPEIGEPLAVITSNLEMHLGQHAPVVIPELVKLLDAQFPHVKSTRDAGALTLQIINLLEELAEQEQSESNQQPEAGDDSEDGEDSQPNDGSDDEAGGNNNAGNPDSDGQSGSEAGSGSPDGVDGDEEGDSKSGSGTVQEQSEGSDDSNKGNGGSDEDADEDDTSYGGSESDSSNGSDEPVEPTETGKSLKELVAEMLDSEVGNDEIFDKSKAVAELAEEIANSNHSDYIGVEPVGDLEIGGIGAGALIELSEGILTLPRNKGVARELKRELTRSKSKDLAKLRAILSTSVDTESYSARNGRLGERYLHRFALDDNRLFERTEERLEPKASVSITADLSGSTWNTLGDSTIAKEIQRTMFMLETVLNDIGAPREMFGFAPVTGGENSIIRTFNDNHLIACERIGAMLDMVGGSCTPICTAVKQASTRLLKQRTQRKLLFVVTDGAPSDVEKAKEETAKAIAMGIDVFYFVLDPRGGYSRWLRDSNIPVVDIKSAGQLFEALAEKLTDYMR